MTLERPSSVSAVDWGRVIERLCFLFPPVIGVGAIGVIQEADPGVPGLAWGLFLVGTFGYTLLTIGMMLALFVDARDVRSDSIAAASSKGTASAEESSSSNGDSRSKNSTSTNWTPSPWLYAAFALLWAPAAGVIYLARRHRAAGTKAGWNGWWLVVALSLMTTVLGVITAVIAVVFSIPGLLLAAVALTGAVAFGTFPIAIHQDAAYVSARDGSWQPNPGLFLGIALVSLFAAPIQPVLAGYYLFRRRRSTGTP
ncbi:hypothetical protein [Halostagnicola sp. A-GB9-2]|uniref:hypothetical protein n=1 Tax=Halostagnicola sp. A-GB9-2 TaxID=3048066 RepID=UPI0024BF62EE|nr:hypothetical protein [Halostagnicola sp. A-GB9-2]MDJ1432910.1 hypothetical protein [Halostagnicola sp. A-GB9-2]